MKNRPAVRAAVRAVGFRAAVLCAVACMCLMLVGDLRSLLLPSRPLRGTGPDESQPAISAESGWPHRRGQHYDAVSDETGLIDSWPAEGPPVLWIREIGRGYSGCTVVGNRLFTQTQTLYRQAVLCLDCETGGTIWEHNYGWPYETGGMYPGPRATPSAASMRPTGGRSGRST